MDYANLIARTILAVCLVVFTRISGSNLHLYIMGLRMQTPKEKYLSRTFFYAAMAIECIMFLSLEI